MSSSHSPFRPPIRPLYLPRGADASSQYPSSSSQARSIASAQRKARMLGDSSDSDDSDFSLPMTFARPRPIRPRLLGGGLRRNKSRDAIDQDKEKKDNDAYASTVISISCYQGLAVCFCCLSASFLILAWMIDDIAVIKLDKETSINVTARLSSTAIPDSFLARLQNNSFFKFICAWNAIIGGGLALVAAICLCYGKQIRKCLPGGIQSFMNGHSDKGSTALINFFAGSHDLSKYGRLAIKLYFVLILSSPACASASFYALSFMDQRASLLSAKDGTDRLEGSVSLGLSTIFACIAGTLAFLAWPLSIMQQRGKKHLNSLRPLKGDAYKDYEDDSEDDETSKQAEYVDNLLQAPYPEGSQFSIASKRSRRKW